VCVTYSRNFRKIPEKIIHEASVWWKTPSPPPDSGWIPFLVVFSMKSTSTFPYLVALLGVTWCVAGTDDAK